MFEHSVKVPRLYKNAAKILQDVKENRKSLKQLIYQCKHRNLKAVYALVAETLKHFSDINTVIEKTQLLEKENRLDQWLARILITEIIWKGKQMPSQAKPIKTILSHYDSLKQHKDDLESKTQSTNTLKKVQKPRFARINTLKIPIADAINAFREEGWTLTRYPTDNYDEYIAKCSSLSSEEFIIDLHIKELLLFSSDTQFYKHVAYKDGLILLQDKASCLAAHLLNPPPGSIVLDMCAAPGMKTTHLAALLNNEGTVYAVELNQKRFQTLNDIVGNAGATCVKTMNKDATELTSEDCPNVEYILVDPSCSGSGLTDRVNIDDREEEVSPERLRKLASFQTLLLDSALRNYPQVKKIVYSTCSIYPQENEQVVSRVLERFPNFKLIPAKELLNGLWNNSSSEGDSSITEKCLYAKPETDLTNGFFIAVIEKIESDHETNENIDEISKSQKETNVNKYNERKHNKNKNIKKEIDAAETEDTCNNSSENNRKRKCDVNEINIAQVNEDESVLAKKKHKKKNKLEEFNIKRVGSGDKIADCKKDADVDKTSEVIDENKDSERKHKKKRKHKIKDELEDNNLNNSNKETVQSENMSEEKSKKKRKHNINKELQENDLNSSCNKREKKRNKKTKSEESVDTTISEEKNETEDLEIKRKKKRKHNEFEENHLNDNCSKQEKKGDKKRKQSGLHENVNENNEQSRTETKSKKKRKTSELTDQLEDNDLHRSINTDEGKERKQKKNPKEKSKEKAEPIEEQNIEVKQKNKKHKRSLHDSNSNNVEVNPLKYREDETECPKEKKKKKSKKEVNENDTNLDTNKYNMDTESDLPKKKKHKHKKNV